MDPFFQSSDSIRGGKVGRTNFELDEELDEEGGGVGEFKEPDAGELRTLRGWTDGLIEDYKKRKKGVTS